MRLETIINKACALWSVVTRAKVSPAVRKPPGCDLEKGRSTLIHLEKSKPPLNSMPSRPTPAPPVWRSLWRVPDEDLGPSSQMTPAFGPREPGPAYLRGAANSDCVLRRELGPSAFPVRV